jgi:ABC-type uncharacterized transport system substrate-binding protein
MQYRCNTQSIRKTYARLPQNRPNLRAPPAHHCRARGGHYIAAMRTQFAPLTLALTILAAPALAHPHMFLDTSVDVIFNDAGAAESVKITWVYDDLSSLQYIADRALDMDGDGVLTPDEKAALTGFDMNWDAGFPGDTYALLGGVDQSLSRPRDYTADYQGGKIITTHIRDFAAPLPLNIGQTLTIQVYDPGFYAAYSIIGAALNYGSGRSRACSAQIWEPDRDAADEALLAALAEYSADEDVEADFPAIGAAYAEEVRVTCGD